MSAMIDHAWWFFLGGLATWVCFVGAAWFDEHKDDDPPDTPGWQG